MKKGSFEEQVLRTSKEIAVKFIETGRVSPTGFPDTGPRTGKLPGVSLRQPHRLHADSHRVAFHCTVKGLTVDGGHLFWGVVGFKPV